MATLVWTNKHDLLPKKLLDFCEKIGLTLRSTNMALDSIIRLSVSEAARLFGVSQRTVRRAIAEERITYVVVQGRYKINFESLLRWSQETTTVRNKRDKKGMGQYVEQWRMKNKMFSPNPGSIKVEVEEEK